MTTIKLQLAPGTPADPPTIRSGVTNWTPGDTTRPSQRQPDDGLLQPAEGDPFVDVGLLAERRRRVYRPRIPTKGR